MSDEFVSTVDDNEPPREPPAGASGASDGGPPPRRPGRDPAPGFGDKVRFVLRGVGQTLITAGVVVLLFVVYQVYITNWFSDRAQHKVHVALEQRWARSTEALPLPETNLATLDGKGIANLYIPRLGTDYQWTIVEGVNDADLAKGPGHYKGSQLPGQMGDFAVAGHRVGKGEPFLNLDKLRAGDSVVVETQTKWFVYCVLGATSADAVCDPNASGASLSNLHTDKQTGRQIPGREIVSPSEGQVILPVPSDPSAKAPYQTAYLTMTTCHPKFSASKRMIVHAILDPAYPNGIAKPASTDGNDSAAMPPQIKSLYSQIGK